MRIQDVANFNPYLQIIASAFNETTAESLFTEEANDLTFEHSGLKINIAKDSANGNYIFSVVYFSPKEDGTALFMINKLFDKAFDFAGASRLKVGAELFPSIILDEQGDIIAVKNSNIHPADYKKYATDLTNFLKDFIIQYSIFINSENIPSFEDIASKNQRIIHSFKDHILESNNQLHAIETRQSEELKKSNILRQYRLRQKIVNELVKEEPNFQIIRDAFDEGFTKPMEGYSEFITAFGTGSNFLNADKQVDSSKKQGFLALYTGLTNGSYDLTDKSVKTLFLNIIKLTAPEIAEHKQLEAPKNQTALTSLSASAGVGIAPTTSRGRARKTTLPTLSEDALPSLQQQQSFDGAATFTLRHSDSSTPTSSHTLQDSRGEASGWSHEVPTTSFGQHRFADMLDTPPLPPTFGFPSERLQATSSIWGGPTIDLAGLKDELHHSSVGSADLEPLKSMPAFRQTSLLRRLPDLSPGTNNMPRVTSQPSAIGNSYAPRNLAHGTRHHESSSHDFSTNSSSAGATAASPANSAQPLKYETFAQSILDFIQKDRDDLYLSLEDVAMVLIAAKSNIQEIKKEHLMSTVSFFDDPAPKINKHQKLLDFLKDKNYEKNDIVSILTNIYNIEVDKAHNQDLAILSTVGVIQNAGGIDKLFSRCLQKLETPSTQPEVRNAEAHSLQHQSSHHRD